METIIPETRNLSPSLLFLLIKWYLVIVNALILLISLLFGIMVSIMVFASLISLDWPDLGISLMGITAVIALIFLSRNGFNGALHENLQKLILYCNGLIVLLVISSILVITSIISLIKESTDYIMGLIIPYFIIVITTILAFVMSNFLNITSNDKLNSIAE